jgi:hypothetical protein
MKITVEINGIPVKAFLYGRVITVNLSTLQQLGIVTAANMPATFMLDDVAFEFKTVAPQNSASRVITYWQYATVINVLNVFNR